MDCREFRNKHVGFVDDTLPAIEMDWMREHVGACARCSRHDTAIRRSLLVVRNLPRIEPSPDFMARLNARLHECEMDRHGPRQAGLPSLGRFAAVAAVVVVATYLALQASSGSAALREIRMPPVVAIASEPPSSPMADPAFVASVSTGMPVWPAVLMAEQAPMRFVNVELQQAALTR